MVWQTASFLALAALAFLPLGAAWSSAPPGPDPARASSRRRHSLAASARPGAPARGAAPVFLRWSPLVGGPAFLPLHVEVIVAEPEAPGANVARRARETVCVATTHDLSSVACLAGARRLHRFDFLPASPTEPATLRRLATLRSVPGRVRHRTVERDGGNGTSAEGRCLAVVVPVGYLPGTGDEGAASAAVRFTEDYADTAFKDLRVMGGKNCVSFALDLLAHLEATAGLRKITAPYAFDMDGSGAREAP